DGFLTVFLTKAIAPPDGSRVFISSFVGGFGQDGVNAIALDNNGIFPANVWITGYTTSTNLPTVLPLQASLKGTSDAFVAKLSFPNTIAFSTYWGGSGADVGNGIAIDNLGGAVVVGTTGSTDFPVTPGVVQGVLGGSADALVTK